MVIFHGYISLPEGIYRTSIEIRDLMKNHGGSSAYSIQFMTLQSCPSNVVTVTSKKCSILCGYVVTWLVSSLCSLQKPNMVGFDHGICGQTEFSPLINFDLHWGNYK